MKRKKTFTQHGLGFVGSAVVRAVAERTNLRVVGVDIDPQKVMQLRECSCVETTFVEDVAAYREADIQCFSINTPANSSRWGYDLAPLSRALRDFARNVLRNRKEWTVVLIRSTIVPSTVEEKLIPLLEEVSEKQAGVDFGVAYNPEFLREADAFADAMKPPVVYYWASDDQTAEVLEEELFRPFKCPIVRFESSVQAEGVKMVNNVLNALVISAFNDLRHAFAASGLEPQQIEEMFTRAKRTAFAFAEPSYGVRDLGPWGGNCLPKEMRAMLAWAGKQDHARRESMPTLEGAWETNEKEKQRRQESRPRPRRKKAVA